MSHSGDYHNHHAVIRFACDSSPPIYNTFGCVHLFSKARRDNISRFSVFHENDGIFLTKFKKAAMNTGRIRMENFNGILYCEAYMNDEFTLSDLESMREEIRKNYSPCTDVILKKTGSYSVSAEAQVALWKGIEEFRNFVYVADETMKKESAMYAAENYMKPYNTRVASTKEEAYALLCKNR